MMDKAFNRVVDFTLTSTTHQDQFSLAYSGHPGSGIAKGCVSQDLLNFGAGKPIELSLMEIGRWKAMNIKGRSNFLKVDMKIKDAKNIIDMEDC
nr:hypothetical protein [Tanacetum cinerariifolium]